MPPKRGKKSAKPDDDETEKSKVPETKPETNGKEASVEEEKQSESHVEDRPEAPDNDSSKADAGEKRKTDDTQKGPSKASRRSSRGAQKPSASPVQMINFLLSSSALDLCRSEDEAEDLASCGKELRTYSGSRLSPFEELLCAVVLSRPISHRLGLRTIRTILNDPYNFTSPKAINAASLEQRHQAMFDARTQHKDKTATQIGLMAQVISSKFAGGEDDVSLEAVRTEAGRDWDAERDLLQREIKGLGKTGLDIFFRRVQWLWEEAYPFLDERTARGVEKLGLPRDAEGLNKAIEENWNELNKDGLPKGQTEAKRRAFVVICERATSADLEGKVEALVDAAAAS